MNLNSMKVKIHFTFIMISDFYLFVLEYESKKEEYFLLIFQIYPMVTLKIGLSAHVGVPFEILHAQLCFAVFALPRTLNYMAVKSVPSANPFWPFPWGAQWVEKAFSST